MAPQQLLLPTDVVMVQYRPQLSGASWIQMSFQIRLAYSRPIQRATAQSFYLVLPSFFPFLLVFRLVHILDLAFENASLITSPNFLTDVICDILNELYTAITVYTYLNGYGISKLRSKTSSRGIYREFW